MGRQGYHVACTYPAGRSQRPDSGQRSRLEPVHGADGRVVVGRRSRRRIDLHPRIVGQQKRRDFRRPDKSRAGGNQRQSAVGGEFTEVTRVSRIFTDPKFFGFIRVHPPSPPSVPHCGTTEDGRSIATEDGFVLNPPRCFARFSPKKISPTAARSPLSRRATTRVTWTRCCGRPKRSCGAPMYRASKSSACRARMKFLSWLNASRGQLRRRSRPSSVSA